jgi:hypothetical protein
MGSREGWMTLGQGLIGVGQNYQTINTQNTTSIREEKAEHAKQQRLSRTDMMTNLNAAADRQFKVDQSKLDEGYRRDTLAAQERSTAATQTLAERQQTHTELVAEQGTFAQKGALETARGHLVVAEERLKLDGKNTADRLALLQSADTRAAADQVHRHSMAEARKLIDSGNLTLAQDELALAKKAQTFREGMSEREQDRADESLADQVLTNANRTGLAWLEHELNSKRIESGLETAEQGRALATRNAEIEDELHELNLTDGNLSMEVKRQQMAYDKATLAIAKDELEWKKGKSKWKFDTQDRYAMRCTEKDPTGTHCIKEESVVVGKDIIAINIKDPDLQEIRILQEDGTWLYGSPDGLGSEYREAISAVTNMMGRVNPLTKTEFTLDHAVAHLKKTIPEFKLWDEVKDLFVIVKTAEDTNALPDTGKVIPGETDDEKRARLITEAALANANTTTTLDINGGTKSPAAGAGNRLFLERERKAKEEKERQEAKGPTAPPLARRAFGSNKSGLITPSLVEEASNAAGS